MPELLQHLWRERPRGGSLPPEIWSRRHRVIVRVLWLHVVGLVLYGLHQGDTTAAHVVAEVAPLIVATLIARSTALPRSVRGGAATVGLVTASALLVHLSGGLIEAHFHFFVVIGLIILYHDWMAFLIALGYVVVHHGLVGMLAPESVYNHPAAIARPWLWAAIHGVFVLAASVSYLASWRLAEEGFEDPLTRLPNRTLFNARLEEAVGAAGGDRPVAVLYVDLDDFKTVNDGLGHAAGDELLLAVAHQLRRCLRRGDTVARFGGDEFVVIAPDTDERAAIALAERIRESLRVPFTLHGRDAFVRASIGVVIGDGTETPERLLRSADAAMYEAKTDGFLAHVVFHPSHLDAAEDRLEMRSELERALERGELWLAYQPIFDASSQAMIGVEALVRWEHPQRGTVLPAAFLPFAEECGLIVPIGRWVLQEACEQVQRWNQMTHGELSVSVNVSTRQISPQLVGEVERALTWSGLPADLLVLEITESALAGDPELAREVFEALRGLGVAVVIDDFGTGYSSLSYLREFGLDGLKIDRSFVAELAGASQGAHLASLIAAIGKALGLRVTAEGIETDIQMDVVRDLGCDLVQGFLLGRPLAPTDMEAWLELREERRVPAALV